MIEELQVMNEELQAVNEELHAVNDVLQSVNQELIVAKEKALESERFKSAFLANFSHEVRTPISGIISLTGILQKDEALSVENQEIVNLMRTSSEHLLTLFNDILDEAKIEAGQLTILPEPVNINQMLIETKIFFDNNLQNNNKNDVNIELCLNESIGNNMIMVDPVRLKQILYNLLSNAVKFTNKGTIQTGYRLDNNNMLEFWVKDTGIGIPEEQLSKMFDRFQQAVRRDQKQYGGTGLGLSISKNLVHLMGGDMYAKSKEGEGSTFYFTIPYILKPS